MAESYKIARGILTATAKGADLTLVGNERPQGFSLSSDATMEADIFTTNDGGNAVREALLTLRVAAEVARISNATDRLKSINDKIAEYEFVLGGPMTEGNTAEGRPKPIVNAGEV